jgi:methyl-accepting chemotaxis protein
VLTGVNIDRMPAGRGEPGNSTHISYQNGLIRLDRPINGRGGVNASLSLGFSLRGQQEELRNQVRIVIIVSILVFLFGCAANFLIGTILVGPLRLMTSVALRIASGDLSQPNLGVDRSDEVGQMAAAFDRMLQLLRSLALIAERLGRGDLAVHLFLEGQVGEAIARMIEGQRALVRQISDAAMKLGGAATQIYAVMQQQEAATAKQAGGVEEVSRTMQSLHDSASNIADSARGVFENAQRTQNTTDGMSQNVMTLSGHTNRIAELLEVIRDIADRSDLLALNASLEATRAGEAGRAFALVASEMRRLAERVTASVQDVKSLLVDIRSSAAATAISTDESRKLAESTNESARQITMVTQQQRTATGQVLESMREISNILGESVTSTREIRASSEMLRKTAEHLNQVVGNFKTEGAPGEPRA